MKKYLLLLTALLIMTGCKKQESIIHYNGSLDDLSKPSYVFFYNEQVDLKEYDELFKRLSEEYRVYLIDETSLSSKNLYNWDEHHHKYDIKVGLVNEQGYVKYYEDAKGIAIDQLLLSGEYEQTIIENELILVNKVPKDNVTVYAKDIQIAFFPTLVYINEGIIINTYENIRPYEVLGD